MITPELRDKLEATRSQILEWIGQAQAPAILCSFGKESMIQVHLTRDLGLRLPLVYHRNHWRPEKNAFADEVTQRWQLEVHDWPPSETGIKVHDDCIQTVSRYQIGPDQGMDVPNGILEPQAGESYLCGRTDILERPKGTFFHPWDMYLMGQKSCDVDIFEGPCPLNTDRFAVKNGPVTVFPLADWTDADVWDYIAAFDVPVQTNRYDVANRREWESKRFNNDYAVACTRCLDRRQPAQVLCPKAGHYIPNISALVKDMEHKVEYWKEPHAND